MYIGGQWVESESGETRQILNPATNEVIAVVPEGSIQDVRAAVEVAREAFDHSGWAQTPANERARLLNLLADKLEEHGEAFAKLETENNGKPLRESEFDVSDAANCFRYYAGLVNKPLGQTYTVSDPMQTMVVREPIGVCGQIVPWNYPLLMGAWKLAPCLAAGNTTVFKPAETTPLTAIKLFELIDEVGFPKGVANLVLGAGNTVGQEIAENHQIDKVAFTGGTVTGRKVMRAASGNLKNISLELGGKNPHIIFDDANFEAAVENALYGAFANQGQVCSAGSRLYVQSGIYDQFVEALIARGRKIRVGNGLDETVEMGPVVSKAQMEKVMHYIQIGKQEGARLVLGGYALDGEVFEYGNFIAPTIFVDCNDDMRIVKEEIFGPVLTVCKFDTEEEVIKRANDTEYGLAGGVFTNDGAKALRVIRGLRCGITWINCYHPTYNEAPWGGYKQSGIGRELGTFGLDAYQEIKQININLEVGELGWFNND
ncbi:MAG: aldehyde dehydrogenase family protein [Bacillaceae bacterium]